MTTSPVSDSYDDNRDAAASSATRTARALLGAMMFVGASLLSATSYAQPFPANACIVERGGNSCTANEGGAITATPVPCDQLTAPEIAANTNGCLTPADPSCNAGETIPIKLLVGLGANNATRYDIGLYISTDNNKPLNLPPAEGGAATCGVTAVQIPPGSQIDPNTCGDQPSKTALADSIPMSTSITCVAGQGANLQIQIGTSYQQNTQTTDDCSFPGTTQVFPGTGSKCNTNTITVPIQVVTPPASVQLVKDLVPGTDPGLFNLSIASPVPASPPSTAANQTDGGSVTRNNITENTVVTLSETAGTGTDLNNYDSTLACIRSDTQATVTVTNNTITMPDPAVGIVCTFTNTRKGHTVTVVKDVVPDGDLGLFDLLVNGGTVATDAADGQSGNLTGVAVGSQVTVSESGGTGTSLGNYTTQLSCVPDIASGTNPGSFTMPDSDVTCTYTNTRIIIPPQPPARASIPTLSEWGYLLLGMLLLASAWLYLRRRG